MKTRQPSATMRIVDDQRSLRELLAKVLEDEGYRVASAAKGQYGWTGSGSAVPASRRHCPHECDRAVAGWSIGHVQRQAV